MKKRDASPRGPVPVLTVKQPWASLIAMGVKTAETRTWVPHIRPKYLLIHAAAKLPSAADIGEIADMIDDKDADRSFVSDAERALEFLDTDPAGWTYRRLVAVARMHWPAESYLEEDGETHFAWRIKRARRIDSDRVVGQLRIFWIDRALVRVPR